MGTTIILCTKPTASNPPSVRTGVHPISGIPGNFDRLFSSRVGLGWQNLQKMEWRGESRIFRVFPGLRERGDQNPGDDALITGDSLPAVIDLGETAFGPQAGATAFWACGLRVQI